MFIRGEKTLKVILIIVANISWFFSCGKIKRKEQIIDLSGGEIPYVSNFVIYFIGTVSTFTFTR